LKNLIFIDGVSGAGKSTITPKLCEKLRESGYTATYHLEGDIKSPVDSFWNAYLTKDEYTNICRTYPDFVNELSKNSLVGNDYALVRYQDLQRRYYSPELYEYLKEREFCCKPVNTPVPLSIFTEVFSDLWRRFIADEQTSQDFVLLDGSFLHHQINDLIRNYNASEEDIVTYLTELLQTVQSLNPIMFYLTSQDVGERLAKAQDSRGKAAPTKVL